MTYSTSPYTEKDLSILEPKKLSLLDYVGISNMNSDKLFRDFQKKNEDSSLILKELSSIQQNVLFGSLLSNACFGELNHEKKEISVLFQTKHREIIVLLYLVFKNLIFLPIHTSRIESFNEFTLKTSKILNFSFETNKCQVFLIYWKLWTSEGPNFRKIIPNNIKNFLNSESLAVWYMMSGYPDGNGYAFRVHHSTKDEILLLKEALEVNFQLKISILVDRTCLITETELLKLYIHSDSRI